MIRAHDCHKVSFGWTVLDSVACCGGATGIPQVATAKGCCVCGFDLGKPVNLTPFDSGGWENAVGFQ